MQWKTVISYCLMIGISVLARANNKLGDAPPDYFGGTKSAISSVKPDAEPEKKAKQKPIYPTIKIVAYREIPMSTGILAFSLKGSPHAPLGRPSSIIQVHLPEYGIQFSHLSSGDIVALVGGLYRVELDNPTDRMQWVPDAERPPGIAPQAGSMFTPLIKEADGGIFIKHGLMPAASLRFLGHQQSADKKSTFARMVAGRGNFDLTPTSLEFTVKTGDIVLVECNCYDTTERKFYVERKGYKVRAIVPADEKTRVRGWVELDANGIPEADLIRDKIAFVRPVPRNDKMK